MNRLNGVLNADPLLSIHTVMEHSSLSKSTIYRRVASGTFPSPIQVTPGRVAWRQSEVLAWAAEPMAWGEEANF